MPEILVTTMVGLMTKEPRVVVTIPADPKAEPTSRVLNLSAEEAKSLGLSLISAAENATAETLMVQFLMDRVHLPMELAGQFLHEIREIRQNADWEKP